MAENSWSLCGSSLWTSLCCSFFLALQTALFQGIYLNQNWFFSVLQGIVWWQTKRAGQGQCSMALPQAITQASLDCLKFQGKLGESPAFLCSPLGWDCSLDAPGANSHWSIIFQRLLPVWASTAWARLSSWLAPGSSQPCCPCSFLIQVHHSSVWASNCSPKPLQEFPAETKFLWCSPTKQTNNKLTPSPAFPTRAESRGAPLLIPVQQCWGLLHPGTSKAAP